MPIEPDKAFVTEFTYAPRYHVPLVPTAKTMGAASLSASGASDSEPLLDASEIQGNVVPGFNKDYQHHLFARIRDVPMCRRWIGRFTSQIATVEEVTAFNRLFSALRRRRGREGTVEAIWVNIAFSFPGLQKLQPAIDIPFDAAFKQGMHARVGLFGDVDDASHWLLGGPGNLPDLVVTIAADDASDLHEMVQEIKRAVSGFEVIFEQAGETLPPPYSGHENFGFLDGVSQPGVRGRLSTDPGVFLTPRSNPANPDQGKPGQDLIWPGEFVLGYRDETGSGPVPAWTRNGSFVVFRRYRQDVDGFEDFLRSGAAWLAQQHPALAHMTPEKLAALLMGRWRSGAPLSRAPDHDDPDLADDACANNNFNFDAATSPVHGGPGECDDTAYSAAAADPMGLVCPFASHIRKANPRDDLAAFTGGRFNRNRILRRGVPYKDEASGERGLLFVCYQASIERQFEFIMRNWVNDANFRQAGEGFDPIISQAAGPRRITLAVPNPGGGIAHISLQLPISWVIPTGGAYFFAPSITALKSLGDT